MSIIIFTNSGVSWGDYGKRLIGGLMTPFHDILRPPLRWLSLLSYRRLFPSTIYSWHGVRPYIRFLLFLESVQTALRWRDI